MKKIAKHWQIGLLWSSPPGHTSAGVRWAFALECQLPFGAPPMNFDYIIVGGGLVGLATAFRLGEAEPAAKIAVIEKESCFMN